METKKIEETKKAARTNKIFQKGIDIFLRWFFLVTLIASSAYSVYIWKIYILNSDWSEEKKRIYISEQSVLPFDEKSYQKAMDLTKNRQTKLELQEKYTGRNIFYPEGF